MQTLETLQKKIESADNLSSIVRTMKALAAANITQYEKAVDSLEEYYRAVTLGMQAVLRNISSRRDPTGSVLDSLEQTDSQQVTIIVFGSDHGFTGRFNDEIVAFALDRLEQVCPIRNNCTVLCVGEQAHVRLEQAGQRVDKLLAVPSSLMGVNPLVNKILSELDAVRSPKGMGPVWAFYNQPTYISGYEQKMEMVFPVEAVRFKAVAEPWPSRSLPTFTMKPQHLLSALVRQHIFTMLYRGTVSSLAAENASRLAAMQAASKNIEELLEVIRAEFRRSRQYSITAELLEIASGYVVLGE